MILPFKKPGLRSRIDWEKAVVWYNEVWGGEFKDEEDLLRHLRKLFPTSFIAFIFEVSSATIDARLKWYGIGYKEALKDSSPNKRQYKLCSTKRIPKNISPEDWKWIEFARKKKKELKEANSLEYKFLRISDRRLKKMTSMMIAKEVGCGRQYAADLCRKYHKEYILWGPGRHGWGDRCL